jgi:glycosyltransferase involved in cell wall biosynthesis
MNLTILYYSVVLNSNHGGSNHANQFLKFARRNPAVCRIITYPAVASKIVTIHKKYKLFKRSRLLLILRFYRRNQHYLPGLTKLIIEENPEVIIFRPDNNFLQIRYLRKRFPELMIVTEVNTSAFDESYLKIPFRSYFKNIEKTTYEIGDLNFFVSDSLMYTILGDSVKNSRDFVTYNGVDPSKFKRLKPLGFYKGALGLSNKKVVGYLGTLDSHKYVDLLIRAIGLLRNSYPEIYLLIVGDGPERGFLENLIRELKLTRQVMITGWIDSLKVPNYVFAFDVAVHHFANPYGCPQKLLEYMASGVPSIGPDIPFVRDNFVNGKHLVITKSDEIEIAANIRKILENPDWAKEVGSQGREYVNSNFTWEKSANQIIDQIVIKQQEVIKLRNSR